MNQFNHDPAAGECGALSEGGLSSPLTAPVNKIIPFSSVDGYGNRTAIFLQGCNQNCLYCHNPETIRMCIACGRCVDACPANALSLQEGRVDFQIDKCCSCDTCIRICPHDASPRIRNLTPKEVFREISPNLPFISGITTSGGECMRHPAFLTALFSLVRKEGKTTFIDTNGQIPLKDYPELLEVTDKTMIDLKAGDDEDHIRLTGLGVSQVVENIRLAASLDKLYEIRTVVVPGIVDNEKTVRLGSQLIASWPSVRYKLIKYRPFGVRREYADIPVPDDKTMESLRQTAWDLGVKNVVIS